MTTQAKAAFVKQVIDVINIDEIANDLIAAASENLQPEDVFEIDALETWAENNGYVKGE